MNICVKKSYFQALESENSPVVVLVVMLPGCCSVNHIVPSLIEIQLSKYTRTTKNSMQYSASHVATTILLLSQNGLRSNIRASNF